MGGTAIEGRLSSQPCRSALVVRAGRFSAHSKDLLPSSYERGMTVVKEETASHVGPCEAGFSEYRQKM